MNRPIYSPSQTSTYDDCPRKWGWRYLDGIKSPPNRFAELGSNVHAILEEYLLNGTAPDRITKEGAIAIPGLKYLPEPGKAIVEGKFLWELPDRAYDVRGIIDCRDKEIYPYPRILDHKTTGDFKWAKTPEQLQHDTQATVYAAYTMEVTKATRVDGRWVYYRTRGRPAAKAVDWHTTTEIIAEPLGKFFASCDEMARIQRSGAKAMDLDPEIDACDRYGGCSYRQQCNLSSKERFKAFMSQQTLKQKMAAKAKSKKPEPEINPPEAAEQTAPLEGRDKPQQGALSLMDKMKKRRAAEGAAEPEAKPEPQQEAAPAPEPTTEPEKKTEEQKAKTKTMKEKMAERAGKKKAAAKTESAKAEAPAKDPEFAPEGKVPEAVTMQGFEALFVDCAPLKGSLAALPLSNLLAECGAPDKLAAYLDANPLPENHAVTMTLKTPEGQACFETLSARATMVVRGQ